MILKLYVVIVARLRFRKVLGMPTHSFIVKVGLFRAVEHHVVALDVLVQLLELRLEV